MSQKLRHPGRFFGFDGRFCEMFGDLAELSASNLNRRLHESLAVIA